MQGSKKRYKYKNRYKKWKHLYLNLQERDAGIYECQIPTQPPQSYPINLNIIGQIVIQASHTITARIVKHIENNKHYQSKNYGLC